MIDLHSHILPQMDDGSQSPEETAQLLALLQQQGVTTLAATPHFYARRENPEDFLRRREASLAMIPELPKLPRLLLGAEVAYFSGMGTCQAITPLQLGNTGLILVEMPFGSWDDRIIKDVCNIPLHLGLTPVLAHVDRYRSQLGKYAQQLLANDVLFQCNADAFDGFLSSRWALQQLRKSRIHFLGSDCHNLATRPPRLEQATQCIEKKLGSDTLEQLNGFACQLLGIDG